jgi:hypothetical protein
MLRSVASSSSSSTTKLSTVLIFVVAVSMLQLLLSFYHAHSVLDSADSTNTNLHNVEGQLRKFRSTEADGRKSNSQMEDSSSSPQRNLIVSRIEEAGIVITPEIMERVPPYSDFTQMYGDKPIILGLDRCDEYQKKINPPDRMFGAAG